MGTPAAAAAARLPKDVVGAHMSSFLHVDPEWELEAKEHYYQLDLKMMNLGGLQWGFTWTTKGNTNKGTSSAVVDMPWKLVVLNLSMNDLQHLNPHSLQPFTQLRSLELSLNRLHNVSGVEVCGELRRLVASHNTISRLDGLHGCKKLVYLDLSINMLTNMSLMPSLPSLTVLNITNNKIKDLDGIHVLSHLTELRAQKNFVTNTIPLAGCFNLKIVDLGDNEVRSLRITTESISGLPKLQSITLKGNPISEEREYRRMITEAAPTLLAIDHILVRDGGDRQQPEPVAVGSLQPGALGHQVAMKEAARRIFLEQIADRKRLMSTHVGFLHNKIREIQREYEDYEVSMQQELDSCMRYLDSLGADGLKDYEAGRLQTVWPWGSNQGVSRTRPPVHPMMDLLRNVPPGHHLQSQSSDAPSPDIDQLLLQASNKLARDQGTMFGWEWDWQKFLQDIIVFAGTNPMQFIYYVLLCLSPFFAISAILAWQLAKQIESKEKEKKRKAVRNANIAKTRRQKAD